MILHITPQSESISPKMYSKFSNSQERILELTIKINKLHKVFKITHLNTYLK